MSLFILFTFGGWTFDFSIGFKRTLDVTVTSHGYGGVYGTFDENGDFVPEGVTLPPDR